MNFQSQGPIPTKKISKNKGILDFTEALLSKRKKS